MHVNVHQLIEHYGYAGVSIVLLLEMIGIPFPGETILILCGIGWMKGELSLVPLLLFAALGNILGCTAAYFLGQYFGRALLLRFGRVFGITNKKLDKAEQHFHKYQIALILFAKFIAGIRVLASYLAGINRMPFALFSLYNAIGSLIWVTVFIVFGRYLSFAWERYHQVLHQFMLPLILLVLLAVGLYLGRRYILRRWD